MGCSSFESMRRKPIKFEVIHQGDERILLRVKRVITSLGCLMLSLLRSSCSSVVRLSAISASRGPRLLVAPVVVNCTVEEYEPAPFAFYN